MPLPSMDGPWGADGLRGRPLPADRLDQSRSAHRSRTGSGGEVGPGGGVQLDGEGPAWLQSARLLDQAMDLPGGGVAMSWKLVRRASLLAAIAVALWAGSAYATRVYFYRGVPSTFSGSRFDGELYPATKRVYFLGFRTLNNATDGSIWYYDVAAKTYTFTGVTMPTPISNYGIAALTDPNGLGFYTFGGRDENGNIITTVQVYYPATNTTAVVATDPWPGITPSNCVSLPAMGVAVVGNKAFVLGGSSFSANGCVDDNSKQTWSFDPMAPAGKRWTQGPDLN